ncbi:MAG TPA: CPBP family intramembrane glutamic endopeptidase [Anaerolineales bacterium]|nr:CPBP family intramembrane glutamic endopeptidase [Anaerolineales bacterium]
MRKFFKSELFKFDLDFNREIVAITILSTLLLMVDYYQRLTPRKELDRVGLYLLIPLLVIALAFRKSPGEFGFQWGDWRAGLALTAIVIAAAAPVLWLIARSDPAMLRYYAQQWSAAAPVYAFLDLIGWEFFFRGFLLFGYARKFGSHAIWLQAVPFALAHLSKPAVETYSTIFGGFLFGLVAWRTRSFVYPFLIHWFVTVFTIFAAASAGP